MTFTIYDPDQVELFRAGFEIESHRPFADWDDWVGDDVRIANFGTVRAIESIQDNRRIGNGHYEDEYPQGSTAPAGITFRVTYLDGTVRHFQKPGNYNSYGRVQFTGRLREVEPVTKNITVYEPKKP